MREVVTLPPPPPRNPFIFEATPVERSSEVVVSQTTIWLVVKPGLQLGFREDCGLSPQFETGNDAKTTGGSLGLFKRVPKGNYRTPRAECRYCNNTVSTTTKNMRTHISNCDKVPTPLGRLMIDEILSFEEQDKRAAGTAAMIAQLNAKVYPSITHAERAALDLKFASAMHETGTDFALFEHPSWRSFFDSLHNQ